MRRLKWPQLSKRCEESGDRVAIEVPGGLDGTDNVCSLNECPVDPLKSTILMSWMKGELRPPT
jgi:hypothetical protein